MAIQDNVNLVKAFFEAVNQHDADRAVSFLDKNVEWVTGLSPAGGARGQDALRHSMQSFWAALPDNRVEMTNVIATEDWVTVEYVGRGTHKGPFDSPFGTIQPTGHKVEVRFCDVYQIKNGKIVRGHNYFDMTSMLQQFGAMPKLGQKGGLTM